jgi:pimeloyl-ACP methyl ester carboxylesterase
MKFVLILAVFAAAATAAPEYRFIGVGNGVNLSVAFDGPDSAPNKVLMLHGFPEGSWSWADMIDYARANLTAEDDSPAWQFIAPDQRGYNRSSKPEGLPAYDIDFLMADQVALLKAVAGSSKVHLVAHDWGGAVAWALATLHTELFRSFTVLNMAHPAGWVAGIRNSSSTQAKNSAYVLTFVNPASTTLLTAGGDAALKQMFAADSAAKDFWAREHEAYEDCWKQKGSVDNGLNWYRSNIRPKCPLTCITATCWQQGFTTSFDRELTNLEVDLPVRVLWGLKDSAFDTEWQLDFMQNKVKTQELTIKRYPSASHWLAQEEPQDCAEEFVAFAKQH